MKQLAALLFTAVSVVAADPWTLERLYTRPFVWGTKPAAITWSKEGHWLAFLWNAEGRPFLDLYSYDLDSRKLCRLTDLEATPDDWAATPDERSKPYDAPPAGLGGFTLSRDGRQAAFSYQGDLYLLPTDGSKPPFRLTRTKQAESAPQFSPDAARLAYLRGGTLLVQDLRTGEVRQVSDAENISVYQWSPDGRRFLYATRRGEGRQLLLPNYSGRVVTARSFARDLAGDETLAAPYFLIPADGGKAVPVEAGPYGERSHHSSPEWSPDGSRLVQRSVDASLKKAQILIIDALTGKSKAIHEESDPRWVETSAPRFSPDSKNVCFTSDRDGYAHLYTVPAAGGAPPSQVTHGKWEIHAEAALYVQDPQWIGDWLYYTSTEAAPSERHFYRIHPDGSGKERLSQGEGIRVGIASEDGHVASLEADLEHPLDLYVDGKQVTHSARPEFARYPWPKTKFIEFPSRRDRLPVHAKILLPPGYSIAGGTRKWPAVFFIHGSGYATSVLKQWGSYVDLRYVFNSYLANHGYVVFDLDYRGSSGYGRDWRTGVYLDMGGPDLQDVLGGIDYAQSLGNIDLQRIGIWGISYGGFLTDMAMFRVPQVFRAGAAFSAVNDWENYNAGYTQQRLNRPSENPEAYRRSSPIYYSANLKNPLLIVHGMVDSNVMFQDAVQLTEKLIHEGRPFEEAFYPEEDHGFVRDETLIDCFRRTAEFFDRNLK